MTANDWTQILSTTADDAPLLVYADWLDDEGFPLLAEAVRLLPELVALVRAHAAAHWAATAILPTVVLTAQGSEGSWSLGGAVNEPPYPHAAALIIAVAAARGECVLAPALRWFERRSGLVGLSVWGLLSAPEQLASVRFTFPANERFDDASEAA